MWPFKKKSKPEIDVNSPVENPNLVAAIKRHASENSEESTINLVTEIRNAVFLVAMDQSGLNTSENKKGEISIKKGSTFGIFEVHDSENRKILPIFTDWEEFKEYAPPEFSGLIMPSQDLTSFLAQGTYDGIVINPGRMALPIYSELLASIFGKYA